MKFVPPMRRIDTAKGHYYKDGNGNRIPGVTTILGDGYPKRALVTWAANATAEYAVDNWDSLSDLSPSARLKELQGARWTATDKAKRRGIEVHRYGERLVKGEKVTGIPDELRGHTEAYVRFLDKFEVDPILVEASIVNYHFRVPGQEDWQGYAGTLDLIAELTDTDGLRRIMLLDLKTNEKGIYGETALQEAAYRFAEYYIDPADGAEKPMIPVAACGAIHITSDDAQLIPCTAGPDQFKAFRITAAMRDIVDNDGDLIGSAMPPHDPNPSTAHIIYDDLYEEQPK